MASAQTVEPGSRSKPSRRRVRRLLARYRDTRDRGTRDELVAAHRGLARWAATKFVDRGEPLDDLEQVALVGLLKAIDRFDPGQGAEFSSYAVAVMFGELRRHFRDHSWRMHVPRSLHDRYALVSRTVAALSEDLGRSPTLQEIAQQAGTGVEEVVEALEVGNRARPASLDSPPFDEDSALVDARSDIAGVEERADVAALLGRLTPRAREVVQMRFGQEMSQAEIGKRLGVSQMQVSRILAQSLARLRSIAIDDAEVPASV